MGLYNNKQNNKKKLRYIHIILKFISICQNTHYFLVVIDIFVVIAGFFFFVTFVAAGFVVEALERGGFDGDGLTGIGERLGIDSIACLDESLPFLFDAASIGVNSGSISLEF